MVVDTCRVSCCHIHVSCHACHPRHPLMSYVVDLVLMLWDALPANCLCVCVWGRGAGQRLPGHAPFPAGLCLLLDSALRGSCTCTARSLLGASGTVWESRGFRLCDMRAIPRSFPPVRAPSVFTGRLRPLHLRAGGSYAAQKVSPGQSRPITIR